MASRRKREKKKKRLTAGLPGMIHCQFIKFTDPSATVSGLATKP
jgi:hypothetical protein